MTHEEMREKVAEAIDGVLRRHCVELTSGTVSEVAYAAIARVVEAVASLIETRAYEERTLGHILPPNCPIHREDIVRAIRALDATPRSTR